MSTHTTHSESVGLGGGRFRTTVHPRRVRWDAGSGHLRDIHNQVGVVGDQDHPLAVEEAMQAAFAGRMRPDRPAVRLRAGGTVLRYGIAGCRRVFARPFGGRVDYRDALPGASPWWRVGGHRVEMGIDLAEGHPASIDVVLYQSDGLDLETLSSPDLRILQPVLTRDGCADVPLQWVRRVEGGQTILRATLPAGNWAGWCLDPTTTLQPDAADGQDTTLYGKASLVNYNTGWNPVLRFGRDTDGNVWRTLIYFVVSQFAGKQILSASLQLPDAYAAGAVTPVSVSVYRALTSWAEGTQVQAIPPAGVSGATWSYRDYNTLSRLSWGAPGGQAGVDRAATATATATNDRLTPIAWDVTADVAAWAVGAANYGWHIIHDNELTVDGHRGFRSSDDTQPLRRPVLGVEWSESVSATGAAATASPVQRTAATAAALVRGGIGTSGAVQLSEAAGRVLVTAGIDLRAPAQVGASAGYPWGPILRGRLLATLDGTQTGATLDASATGAGIDKSANGAEVE